MSRAGLPRACRAAQPGFGYPPMRRRIATITLATQENWFWTWIGSTIGMVAADALAIVVGQVLKRRLPEKAVKIGAAVLFAIFGVLMVLEGAGVIGTGGA